MATSSSVWGLETHKFFFNSPALSLQQDKVCLWLSTEFFSAFRPSPSDRPIVLQSCRIPSSGRFLLSTRRTLDFSKPCLSVPPSSQFSCVSSSLLMTPGFRPVKELMSRCRVSASGAPGTQTVTLTHTWLSGSC